jgi:hypothetical protein
MGTIDITTTSTGWYFTPVAGMHFFTPDSRIDFSFIDTGAGQVGMSIKVNANYRNLTDKFAASLLGGDALESKMWGQVLDRVSQWCK